MTTPISPSGPDGPPAGPSWTPPNRPLSVPPPADAVRNARAALIAGIAAIILAVTVVPLAIVSGALAFWYGRKAVRSSRAAGSSTPGPALIGMTIGAGGIAIAAVLVALVAFLWPQVSAYRNCIAGANTGIATSACEQQFREALTHRFGG